jgi:protein TonB
MHGILILGVSFSEAFRRPDNTQRTMDIVLVQTKSEVIPTDAKHIAQHNQEASGSSDTPDTPSNPFSSPMPTPSEGEAVAPQETVLSEAKQTQAQQLLHTTSQANEKVVSNPETQKEHITLEQQRLERQSQQIAIAQLSSEIKNAEKKYAERPRLHYIDTLSAKSAIEAKYTDDWIHRVESIGNLNYPEDAKKNRITGMLMLNVKLDNTGKVLEVQVAISSGNMVLDEAAKQIVSISSPFPAFPAEMKQAYDQIVITRTWSFKTKTQELVPDFDPEAPLKSKTNE